MSTTNTSLIRRLCDPRDNDSWTDFVNTYLAMVRSYIAGRSLSCGLRLDEFDLDDISQNVWIKIWKHSGDFEFDRQRGRFRTYLYAVTVNALTDFIRRRRKHFAKRVGIEAIDINNLEVKPDAEWDLAYRAAIWNRIAGPLAEELLRENPTKWKSFEQLKLKGRSANEVAKELGIQVDLVYQNTSRVMKEARGRCLAICDEVLTDGQ